MLLVGTLSLYLVPKMMAYQYSLKEHANRKETIGLIQPGRFVSFDNGQRVLYVGKVNAEAGYQNIFGFFRGNAHTAPGVITAPQAYLKAEKQHKIQTIVLQNGNQYTGHPNQADYRIVHFQRYTSKLLPQQTTLDRQRINTMTTWELLSRGGKPEMIELQWRLTFPLAVIVLLFLGLYLCLVQPRQGRYGKVLPAVLVFILYFNAVSVVHSWMVNHNMVTWYLNLWWVHIGFSAVALFMLWRADGYSWFRTQRLGGA